MSSSAAAFGDTFNMAPNSLAFKRSRWTEKHRHSRLALQKGILNRTRSPLFWFGCGLLLLLPSFFSALIKLRGLNRVYAVSESQVQREDRDPIFLFPAPPPPAFLAAGSPAEPPAAFPGPGAEDGGSGCPEAPAAPGRGRPPPPPPGRRQPSPPALYGADTPFAGLCPPP